MVPLRVLSRTNFAESSPSTSLSSSISFTSFRLQPLVPLQKSQPLCNQANPASFCKTPGVGVPLPELARCTEAQKCLFVSPLLATLTHSLSRKSFRCRSYANTRDGCASARPLHPSLPPSHAPRGASIPCALTRLRILPVATGAWGERRNSPRSVDGNFRQDSGGLRLARGANAPRPAGASAFFRSGCYGLLTFGLLTAGILHSYDCARRRDSSPRPHDPIRHVVSLSVP
jgi:hypothetical protein